jgi:hypothetical protein
MTRIITKFITLDYSGLQLEKAHEILYDLKDQIGKNEFNGLNVIHNNGSLNIEGKIEMHSILFNLKAEIWLHDDNFRIKYETNAPLALTGKVMSNIKSYLDNSLKKSLNERDSISYGMVSNVMKDTILRN